MVGIRGHEKKATHQLRTPTLYHPRSSSGPHRSAAQRRPVRYAVRRRRCAGAITSGAGNREGSLMNSVRLGIVGKVEGKPKAAGTNKQARGHRPN